MQINYFGSADDFFDQAFVGIDQNDFDLDILSTSSTAIVVENPPTGFQTTFLGTNLPLDPESALFGTLTGIEFRDSSGSLVANVSNISWPFETFVLALQAQIEQDDPAAVNALFSLQPITLDASTADSSAEFEFEGVTSDITTIGPLRDSTLGGGDGNDLIEPRGSTSEFTYHQLRGSLGNDTFDLSAVAPRAFADLAFWPLPTAGIGGIEVTIDGVANTGTIDKGIRGTDTVIDPNRAMTGDGLGIQGTGADDTFNLTPTDGGFLSLTPGRGNDVINADMTQNGAILRIDYRFSGPVDIDLSTGIVAADGEGGADSINVTGSAGRLEIRGSDGNDSIVGSEADERFILRLGADNLDAAGGWDLLRYDRSGVDVINADLQANTITGTWEGAAFIHTVSNVEEIRGSREGNDTISGTDANEKFEGRGGDDILTGRGGDDELHGGDGSDTAVIAASSTAIVGQQLNGRLEITSNDGTDIIHDDIEFVQFTDTTLSYSEVLTALGIVSPDDIPGTNGNDSLVGTSADETLRGFGGNDILIGAGGKDGLDGGPDGDILIGETRGIYHTDISAQVFRMYSAVFGREPDLGGHQSWVLQLTSEAVTLDQMAAGFVASREFQQTYGDADNTQFVTLLYNNVLDRDPDTTGLNAWITNLTNGMSRAEVVRRFAESAEHVISTAGDQQAFDQTRDPTEWADDVYRLFRAVFDRDPDEAGFTGWVENLSSGRFTLDQVVTQFMASPEFQATYGAADNTQFVTLLYNNVLDREPDTTGLNAWISNLDGGMSREEVVQRFMSSPEFVIGTEADLRAYIAGFGPDDVLDPGAGDAVVAGGLFADTFVFTDDAVASTVTVTDVEAWDTLQFTGFGLSAAQILGQMTQDGDDVRFVDGTETILFANTDLGDITESMITIA